MVPATGRMALSSTEGLWPPFPGGNTLFHVTQFLISASELFASPPIHRLRLISDANPPGGVPWPLWTQSLQNTPRGHGGRVLCLYPAPPPAPSSSSVVSPLFISGHREGGLAVSSGAGGGCWPVEALGHFAVTGGSRMHAQGPSWNASEACPMSSPE